MIQTSSSHLYDYLLTHTRINKMDKMKDILLEHSSYKESNTLDKEYMDAFLNKIIKYLKDDAIEEVLVVFSEIRRYLK